MIICNVDHLSKDLKEVSQDASSLFLHGGAAFHEVLSALEIADITTASTEAVRGLAMFDKAVPLFHELSRIIESENYSWIRDATRAIDFDDAARTVHLSPDSPLVKSANTQLVGGNISRLLASFADQIESFSSALSGFVDRAKGQNIVLDDEYRLAHRLLRDWSAMIAQGQYISSVCLAAATVTA